MNINKFLYLIEAPMKSQKMGVEFEKLVLQELLPFVPGVDYMIRIGLNAVTDVSGHEKSINLIKPENPVLATMIVKKGTYDLNKLPHGGIKDHPDFKVSVIPDKTFLGYDKSKQLYIEAKTTSKAKYRFGQTTYGSEKTATKLNLSKGSQIYRYLTWFGLRKIIDWNPKKVLEEFNAHKAEMLYIFKVFSGADYYLIFALNEPGDKVGFYTVDDTTDLLKGSFELSSLNVLRFVYNKVPLFILERVSVGAVRAYSGESNLKKNSRKLELVKNEEVSSSPKRSNDETLLMNFKVGVTLHQVNGTKKALPPNPVTAKKGETVVAEAFVLGGIKEKVGIVAAGTEYEFDEYLAEFKREVKLV